MSTLQDLDGVLASLDPSVRAIVAPIVMVLKVLIEGLQEELARKDARIEQLLRAVYGRRSEHVPDPKRAAKQRASAKRTPEEREEARQKSREKSRAKRAELPFVEKKIAVPDEDRVCPVCHRTDLKPLTEGEVSEQVEHIPARTVRIRWVREKLVCSCGGCVITAAPPPQVHEGGQYGPNFHAQVVVSKCLDVMPLDRQSKSLAREGCHVAPTQLGAMFHRTADQVEPIYKALMALAPEAEHISADETPQRARSLRAAGALLVRKFPAFADRSAVELLRGIARCDLLVRCHSPTTICSSMLPSPTFGRGWSRPWAG